MQRRTMTLNLPQDEMDNLEALCDRLDMSKIAVVRKALRVYAIIEERTRNGEKLFSQPEGLGHKSEIVILQ